MSFVCACECTHTESHKLEGIEKLQEACCSTGAVMSETCLLEYPGKSKALNRRINFCFFMGGCMVIMSMYMFHMTTGDL